MTPSAAISERRYSAGYLASLESGKREKLIATLSDDEALALWYDWRFWARPNQLPPAGDWFCWLLRSGRGFGKTRTGAEWIIERARQHKDPIALIGETKADVRDVMVELGDSSILKVSPPWFFPHYEPSKRRLTWPNGAVAIVYSGDEPDQLRGPQHATAWADELAKFKYPRETWDNLEFGLRLGDDPRVCVTTTPRPLPIVKELLADPMTVDVVGSTYENVANLSERFIRRILGKYEGTYLGRQELHGEILEDREGALWKRQEMIEAHRVTSHPELERIVVGVDPPGSSQGAECGIVVGGIAKVAGVVHGYVVDDRSLHGSPATWGSAVVSAYNVHRADRVVGEVNFGGDMVENTIHTVAGGDRVSFEAVRATRGKAVRAEPISALYEQGRVHHVGQFGNLEDEMCSWVLGETGESPNRMDALVWMLTELMIGEQIEEPAGEQVELEDDIYKSRRKSRLWR